ncbi:MAG TPA: hypothetical protein VJ302_07445, partial [Blastocatellia bacterium]|nr:hypothetical protein [Blastocatellia bacterium]
IYATNTGQEITFAQLYQEGGVGGLSLWRVPDESTGRNAEFVVKSSGRARKLRPVQLSVKFNRLPPMSSFVKRVSLVRRKDELAVDRWGLQFLLQLPEPQPRVMTNRVAGYNSIGWRLLEDRIRIGVIADNAGHCYEISVPIMMADHHQRREREFVEARGREYRKGIDWFDLTEMDSAIGNRVQGCKDRLRELYRSEQDRWPGEASRLMAAIDRMREGGLQKLSTLLASSELESAGHLATSLAEIEALKRVRDRWSAKANRSKRDAYRQISVWIARNFDRVNWSPGSLRVMAEDVNQEYGIKLSQHRRQIVGQFQLRVYVEQAADKYRSDLQKSAESYACPECGKKLRKDGKLLTACEGGHVMDLDVAASLYYLRRTPNVNHLCAEPCAIPDHLSRYLRLMSASETVIRRTVSR